MFRVWIEITRIIVAARPHRRLLISEIKID